MNQIAIPCIMMRGGTSRGPYFHRADLPQDREMLAQVLIAAMGAGSPLQVDGIGGGQPTTSKVAMLSRSDHPWAEIDYFFAQVHPRLAEVDFSPNCGNILAGVGPAAIETGLINPSNDKTTIKIRNTNTQTCVEAVVQTPQGVVTYDGEKTIDGIPGSAAPVALRFRDLVGSKTGSLFPAASRTSVVDGIEVSCVDAAVPMVIGRAVDFGISGKETSAALDKNTDLFARIEAIRLEAARLMGLGDASGSVIPKFALISSPKRGGTVAARYFTPWKAHPTFAVTGAICVSACVLAAGTVAAKSIATQESSQQSTPVRIEHPLGTIEIIVEYTTASGGEFLVTSAAVCSTARKLFAGSVMVPRACWPDFQPA